MFEEDNVLRLDLSDKLHQDDNFKAVITIGEDELYCNTDAASILEATAYMDQIEKIQKRNLRNEQRKIPLLLYKAVRLLFNDDEEYAKIKKMNLNTVGLSMLVEGTMSLFSKREESAAKNFRTQGTL